MNALLKRLWANVNKNGPLMPGMRTRCWEWTGYRRKGKHNYGSLSLGNYPMTAPRFAWTVRKGPIPKGKSVLHRCNNPPCIRHLYLGTAKENVRDSIVAGTHRENAGEENGRRKLTLKQVRKIRLATGTQTVIAKRFGITQGQVSRIRARKRWTR